MARKLNSLRAAFVLCLGLLFPACTQAGPYLGDWGWCWHQDRDCPRGDYSFLHYWTPGLYKLRANVHPSNLDQYPPGPAASIPCTIETTKYPCRTTSPAPTPPYSDPAVYFGRQIVPE